LKLFKNLSSFSTNAQDWNEAWQQILRLGPQFDLVSRHLIFDLSVWAWIPILLGLFFFYQKGKKTFLFLGSMTVFLLAFMNAFFFYCEEENLRCLDKFLVPANVFFAIALGAGIGAWGFSPNKAWRWIGLAMAIFIPALLLIENYEANDRSGQTAAYEDGSGLMRSLKRDAVFFAEGDDAIFPVFYFQAALHRRLDVALVPADYLWADWGTPALKEKLGPLAPDLSGLKILSSGEKVQDEMESIRRQNQGRRPLQFSSYLDLLDRCYLSHQPEVGKKGDLFQFLKPYGSSLIMDSKEDGLGILDELKLTPARGDAEKEGGMAILFDGQAQAFFNAAEYCARSGQGIRADGYYRKALDQAVDSKLIGRIWEGWGDCLLARGQKEEALKAYQKSVLFEREPTSYAKLTRFYFNQGDYSAALDTALRSAAMFPDSSLAQRDAMICRMVLERQGTLQPIKR
jgi:tetratricopeptide (TPR) repeat protein